MPTREGGPKAGSAKARATVLAVAQVWPLRRALTAGALFPVLFAILSGVAGGATTRPAVGWTALLVLVSLTSALMLATYVPRPGSGARPDVGCTPCAALAAFSVLAAGAILRSQPYDVPTAVLALGMVAFGLSQRVTNPSTCPSPTPPR